MSDGVEMTQAPKTTGRVLHSPVLYDLLAWVFTRGRERAFRKRLLNLAGVRAREMVLDVGCGTGTLAIAAKERVGCCGSVAGIDASDQMIGRARRKAERTGARVEFQSAAIETLPFPDASFDVVLSTLMLHHLPQRLREAGLREVRRVLKPGGRVLIVDFAPSQKPEGFLGRLHRHGNVKFEDLPPLLAGVGLRVVESGDVGFKDLRFVLGAK